MTLQFFEKSHRYKLDGRWVPGVTTLIKGGLPAPALMYWSARTVAEWVADHPEITDEIKRLGGRGPAVAFLKEIPWQRRDSGAVQGTEVHAFAEQLVHGEATDVPPHLLDHVNACAAFLDDWKAEPLIVERPLAHRAHWWAGKADAFMRLPDGRTILIDWKTAASGVWPETAFQLAAYSHAEFHLADDGSEQPIPQVDMCAAVWIRDDGYDVLSVKADDTVYNEFRHIAYVSAAAKRAKDAGYIGQPIEPPVEETAA